jgi:hypothetical protein
MERRLRKYKLRRSTNHHDLGFGELLLASAREIGVFAHLDPRLRQQDDPRTLHITMLTNINWLRQYDNDYDLSVNA